jgi:hypothetical protein
MPPGPRPVPPEAIVIRGGVMQRKSLEDAVEISFAEEHVHNLSVYTHPSNELDEIARLAGLPNPKLRVTTAGAIYDAGYNLENWDESTGHADLVLPTPPGDADWLALEQIFELPIANPHRRET